MGNTNIADTRNSMTLFGSLAIFCVSVPGSANLKGICIIVAWTCLLARARLQNGFIFWSFSVLGNLAIWYEVALFHGVFLADLLNHLIRLLLFFLVLSIGAMTVRSGVINARGLDNVIFSIASLSAVLKIAILGIVLSGLYSLDAAQSTLGFETVSADIGLGLQRLGFPSDIILIFLIACYVGGRNKTADLLLMLAVTVSIFLSFSRYLFAAYALCLILRYCRVRKLDTVSRTAILLGIAVFLLFSASLAERFVGEGTAESDETRTLQVQALTGVIMRHLTLGTGIGSSVNGFIRSETMPFSYEVEWYAMTMQFGLFGLLWFIGNLLAPLLSLTKLNKGRMFVISLFAIWGVAGFTNPDATSLGSAFGFCILMLSVACSAEHWQQTAAIIPMPRTL